MVDPTILIASVVAGAAPIVFATLGETLTEKAGLINLSLDGTILLSAMTAFVISLQLQSLTAGFLAAALVGGLVAAVVAVFSVYLRQNQVAVGFVLTLMARDLAYFMGNPYARQPGLQVSPLPIPVLKEIPVIGPIFFNHNLPVYLSLVSIVLVWWFMYKTPWGLNLRAVGENPRAAFARGINPRRTQLCYAILGGMLVGIAGAAFSLCAKAGWGRPQGAEGTGWIALALVIFGGWHPLKTALGAYLFALLQVLGIYFQGWFSSIPAQVFQVAPFPLMIFTLLIISLSQKEAVRVWAEDKPVARRILEKFSSASPTALGKPYQRDEY
ncbi:MAG: ABC transporter permease [Deltaproteobacteria bacterium]|nr:MAG: ABC transporter permease [Deltaproteobacteria bacterium]